MEKKNLMIFLRPQIIRDRQVSTQITGKLYNQIYGLQKRSNEKNVKSLMVDAPPPALPEKPDQSTAIKITEPEADNLQYIFNLLDPQQ